jgi:hypothetical protein
MVECAYCGGSTATGFQMIAQLSNSSIVHRLYANKTTDRQTPASVVVEEDGTYHVTIFAIRGVGGIVDSNVEYSGNLIVETSAVDTNISILATNDTVDTTASGAYRYYHYAYIFFNSICPR